MSTDWLNENSRRAYPLVSQTPVWPLPESAIVDFGCTIGPEGQFVPGEHTVYLARVRRPDTDVVDFFFQSDAPGLAGSTMVFRCSTGVDEYTCIRDDDLSSSQSSTGESGCPGWNLWDGFLIVGNLADLAAVLTVGEDWEGTWPVEPCRVQALGQLRVESMNVANGDRTRVDPADGCSESPATTPGDPPFVWATCLAGHVVFRQGYNCRITQSAAENSLTFSGAVGSGQGLPCEEVPVFPGEEAADGSSLLTGGPSCSETITSINGVSARAFTVEGGPGVTVRAGDDDATLVIDIDLHGMAVCPASSEG